MANLLKSLLTALVSMAIPTLAHCSEKLPPNELLDDLLRRASIIVRVAVPRTQVIDRTGNYLEYVVHGTVTTRLRGRKPAGSAIAYKVHAEQGTEDLTSHDRLVFLGRAKAGPIFWYALEFGQFRYSPELEQQLRTRIPFRSRKQIDPMNSHPRSLS